MEQTPDFFKTAKEGWVDGIVVQNRELFIYYAVKILHDYNTNTLKSAGLTSADGGRPIPDTSTPACCSSPRTMSTRC